MNPSEQSILSFTGFYRALVVSAKDPKKLGRIKIWCPDTMIHIDKTEGIWAIPANNQMGGRNFKGKLKGDHYYQGTCFIPPKDSWVWIFFQYGNPSLPCYFAVADLESTVVPSENRIGPEYHKKWTVLKTRQGRTIIVSDDPWDERWEITGKKRLLKTSDPSGEEGSVFPIIGNQNTVLMDERSSHEKFLIHDRKGNYLKFDIINNQLHIYFLDSITIHSEKDINLQAARDINLNAGRDFNKIIERHDLSSITMNKQEQIGGNHQISTGGNIEETAGGNISEKAISINESASIIAEGASLISRNGMILDNSGGPSPLPPSPVDLKSIHSAIVAAIDAIVAASIAEIVRNELGQGFTTHSKKPVLYPLMKDLLKHNITEDSMKEIGEDYVVEQSSETAADAGYDQQSVSDSTTETSEQKQEESKSTSDEKVAAAQDAKDKNIGKMKDVDQSTLDKAKDDAAAVKDGTKVKDKLEDAKNKVDNSSGDITKKTKDILKKSLNVSSKALGSDGSGNRQTKSINNIDHASSEMNNVKNDILPDFNPNNILNTLSNSRNKLLNNKFSDVKNDIKKLNNDMKKVFLDKKNESLNLSSNISMKNKEAKQLTKKSFVSNKTQIKTILTDNLNDTIKLNTFVENPSLLSKSKTIVNNIDNMTYEQTIQSLDEIEKDVNNQTLYMRNVRYIFLLEDILDINITELFDENNKLEISDRLEEIQNKLNETELILEKQKININDNITKTINSLKNKDNVDIYLNSYKDYLRSEDVVKTQKEKLSIYQEYIDSLNMLVSGNDYINKLTHDIGFLNDLILLANAFIDCKYIIDNNPKEYPKTDQSIRLLISDINKKVSKYYNVDENILLDSLDDETIDINNVIDKIKNVKDTFEDIQQTLRITTFNGQKYKFADTYITDIAKVLENYNPLTRRMEEDDTVQTNNVYDNNIINNIVKVSLLQNAKNLDDVSKDIIINNIDDMSKAVTDNLYNSLFNEDNPKFSATKEQLENMTGYNSLKLLDGSENIIPTEQKSKPLDDTVKKLSVISKISSDSITKFIHINMLGEKILI